MAALPRRALRFAERAEGEQLEHRWLRQHAMPEPGTQPFLSLCELLG
jgi:hypothetical protein